MMILRSHLVLALALGACNSTPESDVRDVDVEPAAPAAAQAVRPVFDLAGRAARAERVVHGRVSSITYDIATTGAFANAPRTHVTVDGVELVFPGGARPDGRVTLVEGIPLFNVGDEVVLFVARERTEFCPLVDCDRGVVRISDGRAYDADGHPLIANGSRLELGAREAIPEASAFRVGSQTFVVEQSERIPSAAPAIDRAALVTHLANLSSVRN